MTGNAARIQKSERVIRHSRALVDIVACALIVAVFATGVGRGAWHATTYLLSDRTSAAGGLRPAIQAWWGPRGLPHGGHSLLEVLHSQGTLEAANEMVGAMLQRHLRLGGAGTSLVTPVDLSLMSSQVLVLTLDQADGTQVIKEVQVFDDERLHRISPLPVSAADYDPALTPTQVADLPAPAFEATFPHGWAQIISPPSEGTGVFVLHTTPDRSGILIVPIEYSPTETPR